MMWIVGGKGLLGRSLTEKCRLGHLPFYSSGKSDVDITSREEVLNKAVEIRPTHIVNCAAYTHVDNAEKEPELARLINGTAPLYLSEAANELGARLIHISTDYVFDGEGESPYLETDPCAPVNMYGASKWDGEQNVLTHANAACVIRTSWLFGKGGSNFLSNLAHWLKTQEEVRVVSDQINKPTYVEDLAGAILKLLDCEGIVHFANGHPISRYEMAQDLFSGWRGEKLNCKSIVPVSSDCFPSIAKRPGYSALDTSKVTSILGEAPRTWNEILNDYLAREIAHAT